MAECRTIDAIRGQKGERAVQEGERKRSRGGMREKEGSVRRRERRRISAESDMSKNTQYKKRGSVADGAR